MSPYRFAYLSCRSIAFYLWCSTLISTLSEVLRYFLAFVLHWTGGLFGGSGFVSPLGLLAAATLLSLFARGLSASMSGQGVLEGESIQNSGTLTPQERLLVQSTGGLLLLVEALMGSVSVVSTVVGLWGFRAPIGFSLWPYVAVSAGSTGLKALMGLFFAFRASLSRMLGQ